MPIWRWLLLVILTLVLSAWMSLILSQRNVPLMLAAYFGLVWLALLSTRRRLYIKGWKLLALGAVWATSEWCSRRPLGNLRCEGQISSSVAL